MQDPHALLLIMQSVSLAVAFTLGLVLLLSRVHQPETTPSYEHTRYLLILAMAILVVHYLLQIGCGFRAQGDDVGAVVNMLFYSPVVYIVSYSMVSIGCGKGYRSKHMMASLLSMLLIIGSFGWGYLHYGSLHMENVVYVMGGLFFVTMLFFIFYPIREIRRVSKMVNDESGSLPVQFNLYMRTGQILVNIFSLLLTVSIFHTSLLVVVGPLQFLALLFFVISFIALGFNLRQVDSIMTDPTSASTPPVPDTPDAGTPTTPDPQLSKSEREQVCQALAAWQQTHGYRLSDLNSSVLSVHIGVPKRLLVQYLREEEGKTFRVWLSDLRIAEAKRIIQEHPEFSNETVADYCGFSRNYFQNKFKDVTGLTPNEWRTSHGRSTRE